MIGRFEHDMSEAVDALRQEKDRSAQKVEELTEKVTFYGPLHQKGFQPGNAQAGLFSYRDKQEY